MSTDKTQESSLSRRHRRHAKWLLVLLLASIILALFSATILVSKGHNTLSASVVGAAFGVLVCWVAGMLFWRLRMLLKQGRPFHIGDSVEVIEGVHRGQVGKVHELREGRSEVIVAFESDKELVETELLDWREIRIQRECGSAGKHITIRNVVAWPLIAIGTLGLLICRVIQNVLGMTDLQFMSSALGQSATWMLSVCFLSGLFILLVKSRHSSES